MSSITNDIKVGDLFLSVWGYDQTNATFFQVVKVCGQSVRVREVSPARIANDVDAGGMSARRTYDTATRGKLLPPRPCSCFVRDQVKGDIKRVQRWDGEEVIRIASYAFARRCTGARREVYESWYA